MLPCLRLPLVIIAITVSWPTVAATGKGRDKKAAKSAKSAAGGTTDTSNVDQILDRLEKRLLDEEADGLTFGEKAPPPVLEKKSPGGVSTYRFEKPAAVQVSPPAMDDLKSLTAKVTDLENQVDKLADDIQKTKQSIVDDATIDNYFTLEANVTDTDAAAVKNLTVKLDGFPVYEINDAAGLWLPAKSVPLYAGPLQPGTHRLDLEARLVMRAKSGLPVNSEVYRFINKTFDLTVGSGTNNSRWVIAIKPPEKLEGVPQANLSQSL